MEQGSCSHLWAAVGRKLMCFELGKELVVELVSELKMTIVIIMAPFFFNSTMLVLHSLCQYTCTEWSRITRHQTQL